MLYSTHNILHSSIHRDGCSGSGNNRFLPRSFGIGHWSSIPKMELFVRSHFLVPECQSAEHRWESFQGVLKLESRTKQTVGLTTH